MMVKFVTGVGDSEFSPLVPLVVSEVSPRIPRLCKARLENWSYSNLYLYKRRRLRPGDG